MDDKIIKKAVGLYIKKWNLETLNKSIDVFIFIVLAFILVSIIISIFSYVPLVFIFVMLILLVVLGFSKNSAKKNLDKLLTEIKSLGGKP